MTSIRPGQRYLEYRERRAFARAYGIVTVHHDYPHIGDRDNAGVSLIENFHSGESILTQQKGQPAKFNEDPAVMDGEVEKTLNVDGTTRSRSPRRPKATAP